MTFKSKRIAGTSLAISLGLALSACGGITGSDNNFSLNSVNQPVVERANYVLDLQTDARGLAPAEQRRLDDWFRTLDIGYGDRIAIDSSAGGAAAQQDVAAVAARYGLLLADGVPVTQGFAPAGSVRVVVTRSTAYVPGCPDWGDGYGFQQGNHTSDGYGCAVNSNIAAMVADPEHLLDGAQGTGETVVMTSNRAINTYRETEPTGAGGLPAEATQGGN